MPQAAPTRSQLLAADRPAFLLTVIWGGRTYRHSTEPLDIADVDGNVYSYVGGLEWPDYAEESERQGAADAGPSVPIEVVLDNVDVAAEVAAGRWLDMAEGELAFVPLDERGVCLQSWEDRIRLVAGKPSQPVYADPELPEGWCTFSLESQPYDDTATLLDPAGKIDEDTWPLEAEQLGTIGRVYPIVIGTPGVSREVGGTVLEKPGSPAYPVQYDYVDEEYLAKTLIICGEEVVAETVKIWDESDTSEEFTVRHMTDGKGRLVAVVDVSGATDLTLTDTEFWCEWSNGGGIRNPFGPGALERLGDVLAWAMLRSRTPLDLPKWINERSLLNRYIVATYINDIELTPWDFTTKMTEEVPVEIRGGVDGVFPRARMLEIVDSDLLVSIEEGPDFYPVGPVTTQTEPGDIVNRVSISYASRAKDGGFRRTSTVTAQRAPTDVDAGYNKVTGYDPEIVPDLYAFASQSRYGERGITIEVPWIYDESTATTLARDIVRVQGVPVRTRPYEADFTWGWLQVGDLVRFTSESLHLTDAIVEIAGKRWDGEGWSFLMAWDDDPVRDAGRRAA